MRPEIRAGELLRDMADRRERVKGGTQSRPATLAQLPDLGVTKTQSSRWQKLASLPKAEQEAKVEQAKRATLNISAGRPAGRDIARSGRTTAPIAWGCQSFLDNVVARSCPS